MQMRASGDLSLRWTILNLNAKVFQIYHTIENSQHTA